MTAAWLIQHIRKCLRDQESSLNYGLFYPDDYGERLLCLFANAAQDVVLNHMINKEMFQSMERIIKKTNTLTGIYYEKQGSNWVVRYPDLISLIPDYVHIIGAQVVTDQGDLTAAVYLGADARTFWHIHHSFVGVIGNTIHICDGFKNDIWNIPAPTDLTSDPLQCKIVYVSRPQVITYEGIQLESFSDEVYYHIADICVSMLMTKQMRNPTGLKRKVQASAQLLIQDQVLIKPPTLLRSVQ